MLRAARENDYGSPVLATPQETSWEAGPETSVVSEIPKLSANEESQKSVPVEKPRKERGRRLSHKEQFVRNSNLKARNGRQCYIRPEYHEQIQRIIDVLGNKEVSIASYLDNVLAYHFEMFEAEIRQELDEQFKSTYNSNIKFSF